MIREQCIDLLKCFRVSELMQCQRNLIGVTPKSVD